MAKLKPDPIVATDMMEYLNDYSDFSFELKVLRLLRDAGVHCEHGGHYEDPVTKKSREFDVRAICTRDSMRVRLAIECKNLRANFPLLVSCTRRRDEESFHEIAVVAEPKRDPHRLGVDLLRSRAGVLRLDHDYSIYEPEKPSGKSTAQIGRALDGTISANDSDIFEKWSQALSSADDLVSRMYWDGDDEEGNPTYLCMVIPVVVVPDGRLWTTIYDEVGARLADPTPVERCSCYVDKTYAVGGVASPEYTVSYIEIMTVTGLEAFCTKYLSTAARMRRLFPEQGILEARMRLIKAAT